MSFYWSDSKSTQVSRTLLSILADLKNAVVLMVSFRPLISNSSSPLLNPLETLGFTLLYFKMAVMPLVPQTEMADVAKLMSLGNLLARKTTWLVLTTTSATSILTCVFGASYMTWIVYLPTLILFHIFTYRVNTLFPL